MLYIFALLKSLQGTVCDLLDCSECLGGCSIAVQFWEIHCIGYDVLPSSIRLWWLRGAIIRPAAEAQQRIVYRLDRTPPTLRCPTGVIAYIYGCGSDSVWVSFPVSATDNCDPAPQAWCTPPGGWFSEGTTYVTVECAALDRCGNETRQTCTFPVTVIRVNNPPVARSDSADCDGSCCIPVLNNDYDPDHDPLYIVNFSQPQCGSVWIQGNSLCYSTMGWRCAAPPGPGIVDSFTYTISDGCRTSSATVIVYITCQVCPLSLPPGGEP